ncbi:MAG TPA: hypothetical protein VLJ16_00235, partial [Acidobacteriota bacterium]|nr:hypothetical protein [Acidobacteriota bacterium]
MPFRKIAQRFLDKPLRRKLILSALAVIIVVGILTLLVGTRIEHRTIISLAEAKVRHDLASAWTVYEETLNRLKDTVGLSAAQEYVRRALGPGGPGDVAARLDSVRRDFGFDTLTLVDAAGRVV